MPFTIILKGAETMKILAIGNSFSQDATTYLHQAAAAQGIALEAVNLYIGGCSLETHWRNWVNDEAAYELQLNGEPTGEKASIRQMLREGGWDAIATQQATHDSGWRDTYEPFLGHLVQALRREAPGASLFLQETWAYEKDSDHWAFLRYHQDQKEMYDRLRDNYAAEAVAHGLTLIPCGDVIQRLRALPPFDVSNDGLSLCRDGYHMSLSYGRYTLALVWLKTLCGVSVAGNPYIPENGGPTAEPLLRLIRREADQ